MSHKPAIFGGLVILLACLVLVLPGRSQSQETQELMLQKAKVFEPTYQLINETDLNCSFYMHEEGKPMPDIRIVGAMRMNEKQGFEDADIVYVDKGTADGLEMGQIFLVVGFREKVGKIGTVVKRQGLARVVRLEDRRATVKLEKGCGMVQIGDFLLPYEEEPGEIGKDLGYGDMDPNASKKGRVVYVEWGFVMAGTGQWALIDLGRQHCVQIGDQLNVFYQPRPDMPREAIASAIIVDVRGATSTIKVLSARGPVEVGSEVQINVAH